MNAQNTRLVFRDYPIFNWVVGLFFLILGGSYLPFLVNGTSVGNYLIIVIELGIALFLLLWGAIVTVTADRTTQQLTISNRSIVKGNRQEIPFASIDAVQLELDTARRVSGRRGGPAYRIVVMLKDGKSTPFHSYYSSGTAGKMKEVEKLRTFIGVGGAEPVTGIEAALQLGSQMAQKEYQQEQESLTGSEAEEHQTGGIHWHVQTMAFGGTPVTRWFSPDFVMPGTFLFLAQKVAGQGSSGGGLLGGIGKILFQQSMKLYGFGKEDTPGAPIAATVEPLDPGLEPYFTAYTSETTTARRIMNPWVVAPLADWAKRYPLKKIQERGVFGQLAVMFSPRGVYVASMGIMIPEAVEEMTALGVELIKAQGSKAG